MLGEAVEAFFRSRAANQARNAQPRNAQSRSYQQQAVSQRGSYQQRGYQQRATQQHGAQQRGNRGSFPAASAASRTPTMAGQNGIGIRRRRPSAAQRRRMRRQQNGPPAVPPAVPAGVHPDVHPDVPSGASLRASHDAPSMGAPVLPLGVLDGDQRSPGVASSAPRGPGPTFGVSGGGPFNTLSGSTGQVSPVVRFPGSPRSPRSPESSPGPDALVVRLPRPPESSPGLSPGPSPGPSNALVVRQAYVEDLKDIQAPPNTEPEKPCYRRRGTLVGRHVADVAEDVRVDLADKTTPLTTYRSWIFSHKDCLYGSDERCVGLVVTASCPSTLELTGIELAIDKFKSQEQRQKLVIFTDSRAAIQAVQKPKRPSGQFILHTTYAHVRALRTATPTTFNPPDDCQIIGRWIPAHAGLPGNDLADTTAKEAALGGGEAESEEPFP
ncbi:hypothetical protein N7454_003177 [Penicillium verhagenii]|nr:hypothetical protein N7454_003177 [Penicillium verhagenii]